MGKLLKFLQTIRNNWKKSTVFALASAYGINYAKKSYDTQQLMREYCLLASKYGDVIQPVSKPFRKVTVILNPAANRRKSKALFEKYCVPLLHLAGLAVTVIQTEYSGQAKDFLETLDPNTDALVIAGGDGTVSETVTGLLRRAQDNLAALKKLPLGILPLGRTNSISSALLGDRDEVRALADSTMAVIEGTIGCIDLMKVEPILTSEEEVFKPVYSLAQLEWGSFRDAHAKRDKFWYFDGFREYVSYLFSTAEEKSWKCLYVEPCSGCCKCMESQIPKTKRWWHFFMPGTKKPLVDFSKIINENCGVVSEKPFSAVEFSVETATVSGDDENKLNAPHLNLKLGPSSLGRASFVLEGWRRLKGEKPKPVEKIAVRELELVQTNEGQNDWLSIDSEDFEVKPVKISILPQTLNIFVPRVNGYVFG